MIAEKAQGPEHPYTGTYLSNLTALLKKMGRKSDPKTLLSCGDFVAVASYAKTVAAQSEAAELTVLHFLCALLMAAKHDNVWGEKIGSLLHDDLRRKIENAAQSNRINLSAFSSPVPTKVQLSDDLRKIIGANSRNDLSSLIIDLSDQFFEKS